MHLTEQQVNDYAARILTAAELLLLDDHLADCAECSEKLSVVLQASTGGSLAVNSTLRELTATEEDFHLSFAQLAAYVDNRLDEIDREIIISHLEFCRSCQSECEDLQAFQQSLSAQTPTRSHPQPIIVAGWWEMLKDFRHWSPRWLLIPAAAALGLALCGIGLYWPQRQEPIALKQAAEPQTETRVPTANADSPQGQSLPVPNKSPSPASPEERAVQMALATGRVEVPAEVKRLLVQGGALLSGTNKDASFRLLSPQGTIIEGKQPRLRWTPLPRAKSYVVTITDQAFNPIAQSPPLTASGWTPPVKLERDRIYQWQVTATTEAGTEVSAPPPSAPEAKFQVLSHAALRSLNRARRQFVGAHLELGVIYARVGLLDEAEREFKLAEKTSPRARRLRENLQQQRK